MAPFHGTAKVTTCTAWLSSRGETTEYQESEAFRAFESLFRPAAGPTYPPLEERAQKRRKLPNGDHAQVHIWRSFDSDKSVVLASIKLDLVPSASQTQFTPLPNESRETINLHLESFSRSDEQQISLSLFDPESSSSISFVATAAPELLEPLAPHLETAASVRLTQDGGGRWTPSSNTAHIPFCRCVLWPPTPTQNSLQLEIELRWPLDISATETFRQREYQRADMKILHTYLPDRSRVGESSWSLSDFYDAVHVPKNSGVSDRIEHSLTSTNLYPYQQRSVNWMLQREGTAFSPAGQLQPLKDNVGGTLPVSFSRAQDVSGTVCYVSHLRGMVISDLNRVVDSTGLHGGILAEEMGLGKSVELIALMCLNKRKIAKEDVYDLHLGKTVKASSATLIITPPAILEQWKHEINKHAPELKVFHYQGLYLHHKSKKNHEETTIEHLLQFDVVLTSYNVLSKELHFATPAPNRSLRHGKVHERRNSPLVDISWWRVCLDEAQMVESGVSQAAKVAQIIPRCNAWAISGTPVRKSVSDLLGLLVFLRCEPFASTKDLFTRLSKTSFQAIIDRIALRHTKDQIRKDLDIPPQKRVVITVPFTDIEEEYYRDMYRQMCEACFLSPDGLPLRNDQGTNHPETIERMREWLVRLRQICLHSHVGEKNRRAFGSKNRPLRTVQEVLQVMIDNNDTQLKAEVKEMVLAQMKRGHICSYANNLPNPNHSAIALYEQALQTSREYVKICREEIVAETERLHEAHPDNASEHKDSDEEDDDDETSAKFARITILRRSLRSFLELEHACCFFLGNMHYQWKENITLTVPDSAHYHRLEKLETEWYGKAQTIRRELLKETETRTQRLMRKTKGLMNEHQDLEVPQVQDLGGIESSNVLEKLDIITNVMNLQSAKLKEWRNKIIGILTMSLLDQDDEKEVTGEEYEISTKAQDELYVYIQGLRTIIADRVTAVHGTHDALVDYEMEQAVKQTSDPDESKRGHAPHLLIEIAQTRAQLRPKPEHGSLKGVVASARQMITSLQYRADAADKRAAAELVIAQKYLTQVQGIYSTQVELITDLEKEQDLFRLTMNHRLEFYRQLMHISDTVEDYQDTKGGMLNHHQELARQNMQVEARKTKVQALKVKQTYLLNLRLGVVEPQEQRKCTICLEEQYESGILTTCGHEYCRDCMFAWWKINHSCPECRTQLTRSDMKEITYNNLLVTAQEEYHDAANDPQASSSSAANTCIYSGIRDSTMNEIKTIKLEESYGSKIDMIARHLLWIRNNDPGAKTIIYSQFADFLKVLRVALTRSKIGVSGIRDKNGIEQFKNDPAKECFLLDAKSNSSGLNLVNATYVFLCEPLINPALELQAIARVHRIGQKRATTVFMYIVGNTVEEAIYDISVKRRLEHVSRDTNSLSGSATPAAAEQAQERNLDVANSEEIKTAFLSKLVREGNKGEVVDANDLWKCLFGRPRNPPRLDEQTVTEQERLEGRVFREQFLQRIEAEAAAAAATTLIANANAAVNAEPARQDADGAVAN
ncbi:hypothetical protein N0V90_003258 [Kalmusia sp. IMI 367209]|nr:hypothetical protein N0V90_003258 [Kalmusia sp. IMI 367209]